MQCPVCGSECVQGAQACAMCGNAFQYGGPATCQDAPMNGQGIIPNDKKHKRIGILIGSVCVSLLLAIGLGALVFFGAEGPTSRFFSFFYGEPPSREEQVSLKYKEVIENPENYFANEETASSKDAELYQYSLAITNQNSTEPALLVGAQKTTPYNTMYRSVRFFSLDEEGALQVSDSLTVLNSSEPHAGLYSTANGNGVIAIDINDAKGTYRYTFKGGNLVKAATLLYSPISDTAYAGISPALQALAWTDNNNLDELDTYAKGEWKTTKRDSELTLSKALSNQGWVGYDGRMQSMSLNELEAEMLNNPNIPNATKSTLSSLYKDMRNYSVGESDYYTCLILKTPTPVTGSILSGVKQYRTKDAAMIVLDQGASKTLATPVDSITVYIAGPGSLWWPSGIEPTGGEPGCTQGSFIVIDE